MTVQHRARFGQNASPGGKWRVLHGRHGAGHAGHTGGDGTHAPGREAAAGQERRFSQEDVNEIVQKRLARERERFEAASGGAFLENLRRLEERELVLTQKELRAEARERLVQAGLPAAAADFLHCADREGFDAEYERLAALLGPMMDAAVREEVERRFRGGAHVPPKGGDGSGFSPAQQAARAAFRRE